MAVIQVMTSTATGTCWYFLPDIATPVATTGVPLRQFAVIPSDEPAPEPESSPDPRSDALFRAARAADAPVDIAGRRWLP